jgi:hypothetical protein
LKSPSPSSHHLSANKMDAKSVAALGHTRFHRLLLLSELQAPPRRTPLIATA